MKRSRCDAASAAQDADVSVLSVVSRGDDPPYPPVRARWRKAPSYRAREPLPAGRSGTKCYWHGTQYHSWRQGSPRPPCGVAACRLPVPLQGWQCERSAGRTGRTGVGDAAGEPPHAHGRRHGRARGGRRRTRGAGHAHPHRLDHGAARGPRRRTGGRAPLGRAALAGRAPRRGHRPRRWPDRPAPARPGAAARRADRAGRPLDDARGPRHQAEGRRPGGGLDRVSLRAVHRRGRAGEQDLGRRAVAVAGGHRRVRHRAARGRVRRGPRPGAVAQAGRADAAAHALGDPGDGGRAGAARRLRRGARRPRRWRST